MSDTQLDRMDRLANLQSDVADRVEAHVEAEIAAAFKEADLRVLLSWSEERKEVEVNCYSQAATDTIDNYEWTVSSLDELIESVLDDLDRDQACAALDRIQASLDRARAIQQKAVRQWDREHPKEKRK